MRYLSYGHHAIFIKGLDENAMGQWWNSFRTQNKWKTLSQNCSTTVAEALKAGGGDDHASFLSAHNLVWTPQSVQDYAGSIVRKISRRKMGP